MQIEEIRSNYTARKKFGKRIILRSKQIERYDEHLLDYGNVFHFTQWKEEVGNAMN